MYPTTQFRKLDLYHDLVDHSKRLKQIHLKELFSSDRERFNKFNITWGDLLFDYSKNRIDEESFNCLCEFAAELKLKAAMEAMFTGEAINTSEHRAVLHTALRNFSEQPVFADGQNVMPGIKAVRDKMKLFSDKIISGELKGFTGLQFTDVVNIGIGGSDLGPNMVVEALKAYKIPHLNVHFVSNVDGTHISETLKKLNPATTLLLIASKTFTTQETMLNAHTARNWFLSFAKEEKFIRQHFVAMSTAKNEVVKFGIDPENMFEFWDWVGGRYSLWSAIGLSICLAIGYDQFEELLKGAHAADLHFRHSPFNKNIPVIMALISWWYIEFFNCKSQAVIPYDQYLHRFPAYLQQTDMESNGKYVDRDGNKVDYPTGPVIWGEPGTNGQHAFFQLLHQGTEIIPADFIGTIHSLNPGGDHHAVLMSNFFAQTEALMNGKTLEEVEAELKLAGLPEAEIKILAPFKVFEGNRPTNTILIDKIKPFNLGSLIAFYEHKIFVQGVIWNINSFDQWGVELGKKLANKILPELQSDESVSSHDSSTNGLIDFFKKRRQ